MELLDMIKELNEMKVDKDYDYSSPYDNIKDEYIDIEKFLAEHKTKHPYGNYCEAIINKDGLISYVKPSHTYTLERLSGIDRNVLYKEKIPVSDSPIQWLIEHTKAIAVWSNGFRISKNPTPKSIETLKRLFEAGIVKQTEF